MCGIKTKVISLPPDYVSPVLGAFMLIREFNFNFHQRKQTNSLKILMQKSLKKVNGGVGSQIKWRRKLLPHTVWS
jgi:hypothetical protein